MIRDEAFRGPTIPLQQDRLGEDTDARDKAPWRPLAPRETGIARDGVRWGW